MSKSKILIVDDERNILLSLSRALTLEGYEAEVAGSGELALEKLRKGHYDLVILDIQMPGLDGIEVLRTIGKEKIKVPVIMMSGHATVETAVQATKLGAHDFIEKPISQEKLLLTLRNTLKFQDLSRENRQLKDHLTAKYELMGESGAIQSLWKQIRMAAPSRGQVLIYGESGSGKELIARAIHRHSKRTEHPFIKLNCAAVPHELIESELFGHEKGSFTGAFKQRIGKFELADQGTLFLDEIGDMPMAMQAKLLRVLQEGELERIGGSREIQVDVRVIAATNKELSKEIEAGNFREDLFYRLNVIPIVAPPLREHREDIPKLTDHFLREACAANDWKPKRITEEAMALLNTFNYPGNVRELKNNIERLVIMTPGDVIGQADVAVLTGGSAPATGALYEQGRSLKEMLASSERTIILKALEMNGGQVSKTAKELNVERSHLYKKMKSLGIRD